MNKAIAILFILGAFAVAIASASYGYSRSTYYSYPYPPAYGPSYQYGAGYRGYSVHSGVVPAYSSYQPYYSPYYNSYYGPSYYPYRA